MRTTAKLLSLLATCCMVARATATGSNSNKRLLLVATSFGSIGADVGATPFSSSRRHRPRQRNSHAGSLTLPVDGAMMSSVSTRTQAAFLAISSRSRSSSPRPSTVVPALPNQFGHDRLSSSSSQSLPFSFRCNDLYHRYGRGLSYRNTCTKIYGKQGLEEDVATITNPIELGLKDGKSAIEIETTEADSTTIADSDITILDNNVKTQIPPEFIPILTLCMVVTFLSALDRVAMSIAILPISSEFGYTETTKGQISSAVSYGYGLAILPIGLAVSVASPRSLMLGGVFLWSCATLGTPWMAELSDAYGRSVAGGDGGATTAFLLPLLLVRAVMGAAEAVVLPTMQRILANWVPPEKKATVLALVISGFQLGTVGAYLVSPVVLDFMSGMDGGAADSPGWRGMFYLYGLAGLLWMVPWWFIAKDAPATIDGGARMEDCEETLVNNMVEDDASLVLNECELEPNSADAGASFDGASRIQQFQSLFQSAPWSSFLTSPGVWGMTLAHAAKNWELYNLLAWTPTFFSEQYGLNVKESALYSVLPSICGMVGGLTAGNAADYILTKYVVDDDSKGGEEAIAKRTQVRKLFQSIALLGPAACLYLLSNLPEHATTAQILLGGTVGLQAFDAAGFGAATQEKAGERWAGLLYSLTSLPGVMVGSLSVSITGQLLDMMADKDAGWTAVFQLNSAVCVAGALCFLSLYDSKKEFD